ncbi:hypothetical protein F5J12DRAFT_815666 [Pisolithus orientalis]|uniref:uncharacterized protein n=1 Tax=Pisolithus orientalis TaxID=936130 RepID=UPI0022248017|nr:uncharacterized protein F5J12DRAFT_815666 [Pisolithus orientalis]KAI6015064.1 hypothetical protein F5J12DRAFT_815666 [Pisolithus orientalis]
MQRRSGLSKGLARISLPSQHRLSGMGAVDPSLRPRWQHRAFGVPNRIWVILLLVAFLASLTRVLPSYHQPNTQVSTVGLLPKNYLRETSIFSVNASELDANTAGSYPFDFCPVFGPNDDLAQRYGALALTQSRLHVGSGGRIHRVLHKAFLGRPITISVLGGSVSACHGAGDDPLSSQCYPSMFFQWWLNVFPHPASELTNGAMRRTDSGYFGFCSAHHVPEHTDLVILEFDADDKGDQYSMENFELLVRSLLDRPDQPAVLVLGHFSPQVHDEYGFAGPEHWHNIVAQFYDVPHISTKPILYPSYMDDPDYIKPYYADPILANSQGHRVLADVLVSFLQSQICSVWSAVAGRSFDSIPILISSDPGGIGAEPHLFGGAGARMGAAPPEIGGEIDEAKKTPRPPPSVPIYPELTIPPVRINTRARSAAHFEEPAPYCVSANDLVNPVPPSLFYGSGWEVAHPPPGVSPLLTAAYYWHSTTALSRLRVPIRVGAGDVGIYYLKEPIRDIGEGSQLECWVDDNFGGAVTIENSGDISSPIPALEMIDQMVSRGSHYVECLLIGDPGQTIPSFKVLGVFST